MKLMSCLLLILAYGNNLRSQQQFEGYIIYKGIDRYADGDTLAATEHMIKVYFSQGKMRMEMSRENQRYPEVVIILPDSGITYAPDEAERTYRVEPIRKKRTIPTPAAETISGLTAIPVIDDCFNTRMADGDGVFWYADSLFFNIPPQYEGSEDLLMVRKSRVLLKMVIYFPPYENHGQNNAERASLLATEVKWQRNSPGLFEVPIDYKRVREDYSDEVDSQ